MDFIQAASAHLSSKQVVQRQVPGNLESILGPSGQYTDKGLTPASANMNIIKTNPNLRYGIMSTSSNDPPKIGFSQSTISVPVRSLKTKYIITMDDLAKGNISSLNIGMYIEAMRNALHRGALDLAMVGDRSSYSGGLANNSFVTAISLPPDSLGNTTLTSYVSFELAEYLIYLVNFRLPSEDNNQPITTSIVMPFDAFNTLTSKQIKTTDAINIAYPYNVMTLVKEQSNIKSTHKKELMVVPNDYLKGTGAGGADRMMIYQAYDVFITDDGSFGLDSWSNTIPVFGDSLIQGLAQPFTMSQNPVIDETYSGIASLKVTGGQWVKLRRCIYLDYTLGTTLFALSGKKSNDSLPSLANLETDKKVEKSDEVKTDKKVEKSKKVDEVKTDGAN